MFAASFLFQFLDWIWHGTLRLDEGCLVSELIEHFCKGFKVNQDFSAVLEVFCSRADMAFRA